MLLVFMLMNICIFMRKSFVTTGSDAKSCVYKITDSSFFSKVMCCVVLLRNEYLVYTNERLLVLPSSCCVLPKYRPHVSISIQFLHITSSLYTQSPLYVKNIPFCLFCFSRNIDTCKRNSTYIIIIIICGLILRTYPPTKWCSRRIITPAHKAHISFLKPSQLPGEYTAQLLPLHRI